VKLAIYRHVSIMANVYFLLLFKFNLQKHMIPFSPPRMDDKIVEEVTAALRSGWITTGPRTKKLEQKITDYCGHQKTLCVSSASGGLELMLRWFGVGEGDEVILPAYTYAATANVVIHTGAKPVFVESNHDFNIDPKAVEAAITERTKVIMVVDIAGWPCDYDQFNAMVNKEEHKAIFNPKTKEQEKLGRIMILSDAAHSLGAIYKGKRTGALTDVTVFSFHAVKNLTTAEGGAVWLNLPEPFDAEEEYKALNIKTLHGQSKDALAKTQIGNWRYDIVEAGYKYNMTDIQAAIGLVEIDRYEDDMLKKRAHVMSMYATLLKPYDWAEIPEFVNHDKRSSFHLFLLRIKGITEAQRDAIIQEIFAKEVSVNVHYMPLPMMTYYKQIGEDIANYPRAYALYEREITLPVYYDLDSESIIEVVQAVVHAYNKVMG
jgi:dTDP-4-amino-4,6-dideoxygalactose transaminase